MVRFLGAIALFLGLSSAQVLSIEMPMDPASCIDPQGFEECVEDAQKYNTTCTSNVENDNDNCFNLDVDEPNCPMQCDCEAQKDIMDCYGQSCWNMLYSCEHQAHVLHMAKTCRMPNLLDVPFFPPAPDEAEVFGCSCQLGRTAQSYRQSRSDSRSCGRRFLGAPGTTEEDWQDVSEACDCCLPSAILSGIYDMCPDTQPSLLWADQVADLMEEASWPECGEKMKAYPCQKLGMVPPAYTTTNYYAKGEFPENGTKTLYNIGMLPRPISTGTYTYSYHSQSRTVTVRSADATPTFQPPKVSGGSESGKEQGDSGSSKDESSGSGAEASQNGDTSSASLAGVSIAGLGLAVMFATFML